MKILNASELKSIEQFFQLTQKSLLKIMNKYLLTKYDKVIYTENYIVAIGDIPVGLVAHLDTVFSTPPENIFYDRAKNVMWSPEGLGADDRAGVYAIVQLIKKGYKPTIIFTTDEERGAIGASALIKDYPNAIAELKYIVQLDRRGGSDCVFYECDNPEFEEYIEDFGFVTASGTFSDISVICPAWKVAGTNLSIGYVDEHTYSELLYVGNMIATINKVEKMLQKADSAKAFEYIPVKYEKTTPFVWDIGSSWDPSYGVSKSVWDSWYRPNLSVCEICGKEEHEHNLFPVKGEEGIIISMCYECVGRCDLVQWCSNCGDPFLLKEADQMICDDCEGEGELYGIN